VSHETKPPESPGRFSYSNTPDGTTIDHTGSATTPLRYDGQYQDNEDGLYYLDTRYYDPATASFLTPDALASITGQPYEYGLEDPLNWLDPSGLAACAPNQNDDGCWDGEALPPGYSTSSSNSRSRQVGSTRINRQRSKLLSQTRHLSGLTATTRSNKHSRWRSRSSDDSSRS
jgi:RHS repeat-associated protein